MLYDVTNWDFDGYCAQELVWIPAVPEALSFLGRAAESLPEHLRGQLVSGLRWIENLDPEDPFWHRPHRLNRLPTLYKLDEYCMDVLRGPDPARRFAWYSLALHVRYCGSPHIPEHPVWRLEEPSRLDARWLVEAGWLEQHCWGDAGLPMRPVARRLEREAPFMDAIERVDPAGDANLIEWIARERALA